VEGLKARRSMQAELASGSNESVASAAVKVEKRLLLIGAGKSKGLFIFYILLFSISLFRISARSASSRYR